MRVIVNPTVYRPGIPAMNILLNCTIHGADVASREFALLELMRFMQKWKTKHTTNGADLGEDLEKLDVTL
jgi:hypothetical protein